MKLASKREARGEAGNECGRARAHASRRRDSILTLEAQWWRLLPEHTCKGQGEDEVRVRVRVRVRAEGEGRG